MSQKRTKATLKKLQDSSFTVSSPDSGNNSTCHTPRSPRKAIQKAKRPSLKTFSHSDDSSVIELSDWIIKPLPNLKSVCVEGQKKGLTDFWHSSAITEVKKRKFVKTETGTVYRLKGTINKLCTIENGFSKSVANAFVDGFPADWKNILQKFYSKLEQSISIYDEYAPIPRQNATKKTAKSYNSKRIKEDQDIDLDSILTPVGLVKRDTPANDYTVTRSGRFSLPPLARWQGQKYIFSSASNTIHVGFNTLGAEKALLEETKGFMRVQKRFRKPMFHKSFSNSILCSLTEDTIALPKDRAAQAPKENKQRRPTQKSTVVKQKKDCISTEDVDKLSRSCNHRLRKSPAIVLQNCLDKNHGILNNSRTSNEHSFLVMDVSAAISLPSERKGLHCSEKHVSDTKGDSDEGTDASVSSDSGLNNTMVLRSHKKSKQKLKGLSADPMKSSKKVNKQVNTRSNSKPKEVPNTCHQVEEKNVGGRGKKRKLESSFSEDAGYHTEGQAGLKVNPDATPKSCARRQDKKKRRLSLGTGSELHNWTTKERKLFEGALKELNCNTINFWDKVSEIVNTKTPGECQEFHGTYLEEQTNKKTTNSSSGNKISRKLSGRKKGEPVRGGKGTLKRKEDMRELLKEQNEDYEDNLFEGTPFLTKKVSAPMISDIDFDKDDSDIFGSNHNFFTPMLKDCSRGKTPDPRLQAQLASTRKTPGNHVSAIANDTPVSVSRNIADKYVYTFMNQRKKNFSGENNTSANNTPVIKKSNGSGVAKLPMKSLFSPSIVVYDKKTCQEEDDIEEEENNQFVYYWDDEED